jgi:hypothetical protein
MKVVCGGECPSARVVIDEAGSKSINRRMYSPLKYLGWTDGTVARFVDAEAEGSSKSERKKG